MLTIKYTYNDKNVELPIDLNIFPSVENSKDISEWDLLNYVASEIYGESLKLDQDPISCAREGPRSISNSVSVVADEFGFSTLALTENNELVVFVL